MREAARGLLDESLTIRRELGDGCGIAESLMGLGGLSVDPPRPDACLARYSEALAIYRELWDQHGIAGALFRLAIAAWSGRGWRAARTHFNQALAISRTLGDRTRREENWSFAAEQ